MNKWKRLLKNPYKIFSVLATKGFFKNMSDKTFSYYMFRSQLGYKLNLDNPQTYNEKLQWLKLYDHKPEYTKLVDKYAVREYVAEILGEDYLIPVLGVWDSFDEIDFSTLPNQFVLKCNHDSGGLVICRNKDTFDKNNAEQKIKKSLNTNYFEVHREWPYKNVKPKILAERYMEDENDVAGLTDYKFFCFGGEPKMVYVSQGLENHATASISFYDLCGKRMPFGRSDYKPVKDEFLFPKNFNEMTNVAQKIAKTVPSPFVRVDLYSIKGKIYFSEITFTPCAAMIPFSPIEWDKTLGEWIQLPK